MDKKEEEKKLLRTMDKEEKENDEDINRSENENSINRSEDKSKSLDSIDKEKELNIDKHEEYDGPPSDKPLSLIEHLEELRRRIIPPLIFFFVAFGVSFVFSEKLLHLFFYPVKGIIKSFIFTKPFEAFWVYMKVSAITALFFTIPIFIWEIWLFISPALYPRERKIVSMVIISFLTLFILGGIFGYFIVLPSSFNFLIKTFSTDFLQPLLNISDFLSFSITFLIAFGFVFQVPLVVVVIVKLGLVDPKTLSGMRKFVIVGAFILSAIITPTPDALNQTLLALPIIILWEIGLLIAKIIK